MRFADALGAGKTHFGKPDRMVTTFVSKLFVFGERVLKVYKHEPFFFADLLAFDSRKQFYADDFYWNNKAAPAIYVALHGISERDGEFDLVPPESGEDFVIEMQRIDDSKTLTKLLESNTLEPAHVAAFVDAVVAILRTLTTSRRDDLADLFAKPLQEIVEENSESMRSWIYGAQPYIPKQDADMVIDLSLQAIRQEPYFSNATTEAMSASIDANSDNLLLLSGEVSFIDIMPPMRIWRVVDEYSTIARTIVDFYVMGNDALGKAAREAYSQHGHPLPPRAALVYEIRAAAIQWSYRHSLGQHDLAEKFGRYATSKAEELRAILE